MSDADLLTVATVEQESATDLPEYILKACEAAGEWWAKSDRDPRIKFQPAVILKLLTAIREGMHYEPACALAGVSYRQFLNWQNIAEDQGPETPHGVVSAALKVAEAEAEGETVRYVRAASRLPQFWTAGMTFLERRHPDRWRRPDAGQTVNVQVGVALGVQVSDEQRGAYIPRLSPVVISQNQAQLCDVPSAGDQALSPPSNTLSALSPVPQTAVSADIGEAKATPNRGVSPPDVA